MFTSIWKIIVGLCWRMGKSAALIPPSSVDHAKETLLDMQLQRMNSLMRIADEKAHLDAITKKIELLKLIINNDVDNDVFKSLADMDISTSIVISPQGSSTSSKLTDHPMFDGLENIAVFKKTKPFSTINR
jgi:hypothetical protein